MINIAMLLLRYIANLLATLFNKIRNIFERKSHGQEQDWTQHHSLQSKQIEYNNKQVKPCPRWGQSCVAVQQGFLVFGGFRQQAYFNDLWYFCIPTLKWINIAMEGKIGPSARSCSSLHYQSTNSKVVLFAGRSKQAYNNDVYFLKWGDNKEWEKLQYQQEDARPAQRTYHSSTLFEKYVFIFGGFGATCFNDLWVFDLKINKWKQLHTKNEISPRQFHSSVIIGSKLFIVSGANSQNKLLSNIYSIDLKKYIQQQTTNSLQWVLVRNDSLYLARWGHSCVEFQNNVLILGGKQVGHNLCIFDTKTNNIKAFKVQGEQNYRKGCFQKIGQCLICFGGLQNGKYNESFRYLNVQIIMNRNKLDLQEILYIPSILNGSFSNELDSSIHKLTAYIQKMYFNKKVRLGSLIYLSQQEYKQYLFLTAISSIGEKLLKVNQCFSALLAVSNAVNKSQYFKNIIDQNSGNKQISIFISESIDYQAISAVIRYINTDCIILSQQFTLQTLINIHALANYFLLQAFTLIIESQLIKKINKSTCMILLQHSSLYNSVLLFQQCIKHILLHNTYLDIGTVEFPLFQEDRIAKIKENLRFEIVQMRKKKEKTK